MGSVPEDIEDVLKLIEKSYEIKFEENELGHIRTFGQLTDHIISKINLESKDDCTNQQAFYKLRTAICAIKADQNKVEPKTQLTDIFPRRTRRKEIKEIERRLELNLKALRPRHIITNSLLLILLFSIVGLFIKWQLGLAGLLLSVGGLWISEKTGSEFKDKAIGELADRLTQLNYIKSRRQSGTTNIKEIHDKIEKLFVDNLGLKDKTIDKDTVII